MKKFKPPKVIYMSDMVTGCFTEKFKKFKHKYIYANVKWKPKFLKQFPMLKNSGVVEFIEKEVLGGK